MAHDREIDVGEDDLVELDELFEGVGDVRGGIEILGDVGIGGEELQRVDRAAIGFAGVD